MDIQVENIKCGGCAGTITKKINEIEGVSEVNINIEQGVVEVAGEGLDRDEIAQKLESLGYPESGTVAGIKAAKAKAKSVVSCAVGRLDKH
ncbi:MAG: heavy-metal-associated domain-containing protein [bacterium]